jgi:hypothetical protein
LKYLMYKWAIHATAFSSRYWKLNLLSLLTIRGSPKYFMGKVVEAAGKSSRMCAFYSLLNCERRNCYEIVWITLYMSIITLKQARLLYI